MGFKTSKIWLETQNFKDFSDFVKFFEVFGFWDLGFFDIWIFGYIFLIFLDFGDFLSKRIFKTLLLTFWFSWDFGNLILEGFYRLLNLLGLFGLLGLLGIFRLSDF